KGLGPAQLPGEVPQVQAGHLVLQRAERYAEIPRRRGDVPVGFLERAQDEVALEGVARLLEPRLAQRRRGVELGEMILEREILVGDPLLVAHGDEALDEVFELADVAGPPVRREDLERRLGDALDRLPELRLVAVEEQPRELREILDAIAER